MTDFRRRCVPIGAILMALAAIRQGAATEFDGIVQLIRRSRVELTCSGKPQPTKKHIVVAEPQGGCVARAYQSARATDKILSASAKAAARLRASGDTKPAKDMFRALLSVGPAIAVHTGDHFKAYPRATVAALAKRALSDLERWTCSPKKGKSCSEYGYCYTWGNCTTTDPDGNATTQPGYCYTYGSCDGKYDCGGDCDY